MKTMKKLLAVLLMLCLFAAMSASAFADYKYTIRVYGGNMGKVNGQSVYSVTKGYEDSFSISTSAVSVTNGKYYPKGFRISGQDS